MTSALARFAVRRVLIVYFSDTCGRKRTEVTCKAALESLHCTRTQERTDLAISALKTVFLRSRQKSYLLHAFKFGYNDFGHIVTSPVATLFVGSRRRFCSFTTIVGGFLYSLKCKLGCEAATQTFYHRKVT